MDTKVHENKLRRMAQRQGLQILKSKRRDKRAFDYGLFQLVDPKTQVVLFQTRSLEDLELILTGGRSWES